MVHYNFVIPYRDRPNSRKIFIERFPIFLRSQKYIDSFNILIVEQEFGKLFNLAKIINIGFDVCLKQFSSKSDDRFIFFPIDLIPLSGSFSIPADSCVIFCPPPSDLFPAGFGKAFGFTNKSFEKMNGFSNNYWGWGKEDEDMQMRLQVQEIPTFGSYMDFDFLVSNGIEPSEKDVDPKNSDASNFGNNQYYLGEMLNLRDPFISGLNNLSYSIINPISLIDESNNIYQVKVSI